MVFEHTRLPWISAATRNLVATLCVAVTLPMAARSQTSSAPATAAVTQPATTQAAAPAKSAAPTQTLPQQIAALPKLDPQGIDVDARAKDILDHLNAVLRYYHDSLTSPQKIGEPSDALYVQQATTQATNIGQYAFQAARNEAALLTKISGKTLESQPGAPVSSTSEQAQAAEAQRLAQLRSTTQAKLSDLMTQDAALEKQISTAKAKDLPPLKQQDEQLDGQVELQKAMLDALTKIAALASSQGTGVGLAGDIDRLQRTAPELVAANSKPAAPPVLQSLSAARESGVSSQAVALFQLLTTLHIIDTRINSIDDLAKQAEAMRTPMVGLLRSTIQQGDAAMQVPPDTNAKDADIALATRKRYDGLATTFRVLSAATLPLSQEIVELEQARSNLQSWRAIVDTEYKTIRNQLLLHIVLIALTLIAIAIISSVWKRMTVKYVKDPRRRRQILVLRRIVTGFLTGLALIFGFTTQFSSLATFAGFITAGIAVGLQTILLSVAAYFFIVGRYGVRVGDRITVAGVTGDVVDVGLVRFYMMELTGTGTELHPTGRVAVFANSVLFQSGTPLYKQIPGTEYAWHELTVHLNPDTDYRPATTAVLAAVQTVYDTYRARIELQHKQVEDWMDSPMEAPQIEPRLQLGDSGLQYAVLFPVEMKDASNTDEQIVQKLLANVKDNEAARKAIAAPPIVKAVIKT